MRTAGYWNWWEGWQCMGRRHAAPSGLRAAHRAGKLLLHGQLCCLPQEEPRGNRAVVTEQVPSLQRHSHLILFVPMLLETVQEMLPCSVNRFLLMVISSTSWGDWEGLTQIPSTFCCWCFVLFSSNLDLIHNISYLCTRHTVFWNTGTGTCFAFDGKAQLCTQEVSEGKYCKQAT